MRGMRTRRNTRVQEERGDEEATDGPASRSSSAALHRWVFFIGPLDFKSSHDARRVRSRAESERGRPRARRATVRSGVLLISMLVARAAGVSSVEDQSLFDPIFDAAYDGRVNAIESQLYSAREARGGVGTIMQDHFT